MKRIGQCQNERLNKLLKNSRRAHDGTEKALCSSYTRQAAYDLFRIVRLFSECSGKRRQVESLTESIKRPLAGDPGISSWLRPGHL